MVWAADVTPMEAVDTEGPVPTACAAHVPSVAVVTKAVAGLVNAALGRKGHCCSRRYQGPAGVPAWLGLAHPTCG